MKNSIIKGISFFISNFSPGLLKSTYRNLSKIKVFRKSIDDVIIFFIPKKIKLNKYYLFLNQKDAVVSGAIALGVYERFETEIFLKSLKPEMTVVDIGANIGYYTLLAAQRSKSVLAFEPDQTNYDLLVKNITENNCGNVACFKLAISDKNEEITLFKNPNNYGDCRIYPFSEGTSKAQVSSVALDGFIQKINLTHVDFIKIDIQGAEGYALAGMEKILEQSNLELLIEFFPYGLRMSGFDPINILENLSNKKFRIYYINDNKHSLDLISDFKAFADGFKNIDYANLYCKK